MHQPSNLSSRGNAALMNITHIYPPLLISDTIAHLQLLKTGSYQNIRPNMSGSHYFAKIMWIIMSVA